MPARRRRPLLLAAAGAVVLVVVVVVALVVRGGGGSFSAVPLGSSEGPAGEPGDEAWSVPLSEEGLTTVVGGEDVVLVTEDAVHVTALDAGDGEELWTAELEGGDFNRAVPLKGGDVLLETEPEQDEPVTRLVDARTGEERWTAEGAILTIYRDHTSTDASSIHDLDVVALDGDGEVVGVDRETGEERWSIEDVSDGGACGGVLVLATDGIGEPFAMVAVDPATGEEIWSADGRVGGCRDGRVALTDDTDITIHDAADGAEVASVRARGEAAARIATPLGEHLLVQGVDDAGESFVEIAPIEDGSLGRPVFARQGVLATPVGDGSVVLATPTSTLDGDPGVFVRVDDGEELGTTETDESRADDCFATVTPTQVVVCASTATVVAGHSVADGSERWTLDVGEPVQAVGVVGDRVVVATEDRVVAYR